VAVVCGPWVVDLEVVEVVQPLAEAALLVVV
jgi:hypothetical protein